MTAPLVAEKIDTVTNCYEGCTPRKRVTVTTPFKPDSRFGDKLLAVRVRNVFM